MRNTIFHLVRSIAPCDALERDHITDTLAWIDSGAPLCRVEKPATPARHLVSYFVLVDRQRQRMLLVDHRKAELWLPSGGHVEPDEHPQETVRRELMEELSITASFLIPDPFFLTVTETVGSTAGHTDVSLWYLLAGDCTECLAFDAEEFHTVAWFDLAALPLERTDPHLERFARKLEGFLGKRT